MANIFNSIIPGYENLVLDESFLEDEMKFYNLNFNSIQDRLTFKNRIAGAGKFANDSIRILTITNINKTFDRVPVIGASGNAIIVNNSGTTNDQFYQNSDILQVPIPGYEDRLATAQFTESEMIKRNWKFLNQNDRNSFINFIMGPSKVIYKGKALENLLTLFARVPIIIDGGNNGNGSGNGNNSGGGSDSNTDNKSNNAALWAIGSAIGLGLIYLFASGSDKEKSEKAQTKGVSGVKPAHKPIKTLLVNI
jgi:hypothetical protein